MSSNVDLPTGSITTDLLAEKSVTADKTDFGGDYSTSEVNTGFKWIDGNYIYKKTVLCSPLPDTGTKTFAHGASVNIVLDIWGWMFTTSTNAYQQQLPLTRPVQTTNAVGIYADSTNITIEAASNRSASSAYITLCYTKT